MIECPLDSKVGRWLLKQFWYSGVMVCSHMSGKQIYTPFSASSKSVCNFWIVTAHMHALTLECIEAKESFVQLVIQMVKVILDDITSSDTVPLNPIVHFSHQQTSWFSI